ncbi:MFS transporter [Cellulosimicrobium cellulans]|uniref:MFS transporter n=1 Tax=Cellulosimicrobium cellulans TaxID=1710 RepID=UPI00165213BA|nr:MFS transporter [Cellulosimicrobium cellulans]
MTASAPPGTAQARPALRGVVGFLVVMELGSGMLQGWYPVLLSAIGSEFGVTAASLNWVSAAYMLATVVCVPIIAKLGDRYGHRRMLTVAAALVALGSVVVALAPSFAVLLVGRALQAPLAAFLPLEFAIVRDRDPKSAGRSIGKLVGALTFGAAIGSLGAGALYGAVGDLRLVLWVPALFLAVCVPVVAFLVPESRVRASGTTDWLGAALLGVGLLAVLGGISNAASWGWTSPLTALAVLGGLVLLVAWVAVERRVAHPLVDVTLLVRGGIGLPIVIAFLFGAQLFGSQTASTLFMLSDPGAVGFGLGLTSAAVGIVSLVVALAAFVASSAGDRVATRLGVPGAVALGGALLTVSYVGLLLGSGSAVVVVAAMLVGGLGNGVLISVLPTIVVTRAPADSVGIASALYNTSRTAAGAVAGAVFALLMASFVATVGSGDAAVTTTSFTGYVAVWAVCAAIGVAVTALARFLRGPAPADPLAAAPAEAAPAEAAPAATVPAVQPVTAGEHA